MKENQLKWYHYLISILFVVVGALFIAYSDIDIPFICKVFACVFAAAGIVSILSYVIRDIASGYYRLDLVYGVMSGFAALVFFTRQEVVATYFPIIVGSMVVANGVIKLQHSIDMKRIDRKMKKVTEMWLVVMIFALLCIAAGSVIVFMTPSKNRTLFLFVGISLIVAGVSDVLTHIAFNKKVRQFKSGDYLTTVPEPEEVKPSEGAESTTESTMEPTSEQPEEVIIPEEDNGSDQSS